MRNPTRARSAFTLVEVLVVIGVVALLLAILMPALSSARHAALDLRCRSQLRTVTSAFIDFASDSGVALRGQSRQLGDKLFRLEDFQESVYGIDEFWAGPRAERVSIDPKGQPMMCPAGPARLEKRFGLPCSSGAIGPQKNVSVGFNKRLETRTRWINGQPFPAKVILTERVLHYPDVPLLFDVDGETAASRNAAPYYSTPPTPPDAGVDVFTSGFFWFPSTRHRSRMNVGFIGGHVLSSRQPLDEPWWRWYYQPDS